MTNPSRCWTPATRCSLSRTWEEGKATKKTQTLKENNLLLLLLLIVTEILNMFRFSRRSRPRAFRVSIWDCLHREPGAFIAGDTKEKEEKSLPLRLFLFGVFFFIFIFFCSRRVSLGSLPLPRPTISDSSNIVTARNTHTPTGESAMLVPRLQDFPKSFPNRPFIDQRSSLHGSWKRWTVAYWIHSDQITWWPHPFPDSRVTPIANCLEQENDFIHCSFVQESTLEKKKKTERKTRYESHRLSGLISIESRCVITMLSVVLENAFIVRPFLNLVGFPGNDANGRKKE